MSTKRGCEGRVERMARLKNVYYHCARCGARARSGALPEPPALAIYPLPHGWRLVPVADLSVDDDLHCGACVAAVAAAPEEDDDAADR